MTTLCTSQFSFDVPQQSSGPVLLLAAWSASTTLNTWAQYPDDIKKRTFQAARHLPYTDSPRSKWERYSIQTAVTA